MNVLNVHDIERELARHAARAFHEPAKRWVLSVARNYFLDKLPEKDVLANYRTVTTSNLKAKDPAYKVFKAADLPAWADKAIADGTLVWFDTIQPRRREFWNVLEVIVLWFNNWKADDTRLRRIDRIAFPVAVNAAVLWYKDVSENIWNYVTDKPVLVKTYDHGFTWVKLVTKLQFEREGKLMGHCVGNGSYYNSWRLNNESAFYSLRDKHNNPHVTMQVAFTGNQHPSLRKGSVNQCKGNSNRKPDAKYQPYIRKFITDMGWTISGDGSMIDMASGAVFKSTNLNPDDF